MGLSSGWLNRMMSAFSNGPGGLYVIGRRRQYASIVMILLLLVELLLINMIGYRRM